MRPAVHPAFARLRRDAATVQLGTEPGPTLILGGLEPVVADVVVGLDGRRRLTDLRRAVVQRGGDPAALEAAVAELDRAGVLVDARLPPERVADVLVAGSSAAGVGGRRLAGTWVEVRGADRVGAAAASLLAALGTGLVTVDDSRVTEPGEPCAGALTDEDVGRRRGPAAERVARAAGRRARASERRPARPDLVLLAPGALAPRDTASALVAEGSRTWSSAPAQPRVRSARWSCRASPPACAATTCTAPTATRPGHGSPSRPTRSPPRACAPSRWPGPSRRWRRSTWPSTSAAVRPPRWTAPSTCASRTCSPADGPGSPTPRAAAAGPGDPPPGTRATPWSSVALFTATKITV